MWAAVSLFGLILTSTVIAAEALRRSRLVGFIGVTLFALGRVVLVLPYCPQPRLEFAMWHWIAGAGLFLAGLVFASPAVRIKPFTGPDGLVGLRTSGLYGWVRNPLYLGELLWSAGLALWFGSVIGLVLIPVWWLSLVCLTLIEETNLQRSLGEPYRAYMRTVRARIIPGLPV